VCNDVQEFNSARKQSRQHLVVDEAAENVVFVTGRKREEIAPLGMSSAKDVGHNDTLLARHTVEGARALYQCFNAETSIIKSARIDSMGDGLVSKLNTQRCETVRMRKSSVLVRAIRNTLVIQQVSHKGTIDDDL